MLPRAVCAAASIAVSQADRSAVKAGQGCKPLVCLFASAQTLVAKCIDEYISLRVAQADGAADAKVGRTVQHAANNMQRTTCNMLQTTCNGQHATCCKQHAADHARRTPAACNMQSLRCTAFAPLLQPIDARLEAIVEKMFDRCFADQECVVDIATQSIIPSGLRVRGAKRERG